MPINNPITSDPEAKEMSQHPKLEGDIIIPVLFIFLLLLFLKTKYPCGDLAVLELRFA